MNKTVSLREAYNKNKSNIREAKKLAIESQFVTFNKLTENTDLIRQLAEDIDKFEEMATISRAKFPKFFALVSEQIDNLRSSSTKKEASDLFQESLYNLSVISDFTRQVPNMFDGTEKSLQEAFKNSTVGSIKLDASELEEVIREFSQASEGHLNAFAKHAPKLPTVVSENVVKKLLENVNEDQIVKELSSLNEADLKALVTSLDKLTNIVNRLGPEFKRTQAGMQKFTGRFRNAASGGFAGLTVDNQKRLLAQAEMIMQMFYKLGQTWPNVKRLFGDALSDVDNVQEFQKATKQFQATMKKQLGGGILAGLGRLFGRNSVVFPAEINPDIVISDMMTILSAPDENAPELPELGPPTPRPARRTGNIPEGKFSFANVLFIMEDLAKLDGIMTSFASAAPIPPKPEETAKVATAVATNAKDPENAAATPGTDGAAKPEAEKVPESAEAAIEMVKNSSIPDAKKKELITKAAEKALTGDIKAAFIELAASVKAEAEATAANANTGPATTADVASSSSPSTAPASAGTTEPAKATKAPRRRGVKASA